MTEGRLTADILRQRQSLPLEAKEVWAQQRIRDHLEKTDGDAYVSFSGGKDSTVLLHLARQVDPRIPAVFCNTGQEYPEIRAFVKTIENVIEIRPDKRFKEIVNDYGWPVLSKRTADTLELLQRRGPGNEKLRNYYLTGVRSDGQQTNRPRIAKKWIYLQDAPFKISARCCEFLKKKPFKKYSKQTGRHPMVGIMAADSRDRLGAYIDRGGCNALRKDGAVSWPLGIWTDDDIWGYLKKHQIRYAGIYDKGVSRTGCMFCLFGIQMDTRKNRENRIQALRRSHPKLWDYYVNRLGMREVMDFLGFPVDPDGQQQELWPEEAEG